MDAKKGILVVSFGTSHPITRAATIDAIEDSISKAFPDIRVYRAWTSKMIIAKIRKNTMERIPTVSEALCQMAEDGITDVYIQPTHVINGIENDQMKADAMALKDSFHSISFGMPLLSSTQDMEELIHIITEAFPSLADDEVLILMGHGSDHYTNTAYAALDYMFKEKGHPNIYVGTVEAYPSLDHILCRLPKKKVRRIHLTPLMIVAGDHAIHDMAGDSNESWASICKDAGYDVACHLTGLGEYPAIRRLIIRHLFSALNP